MIRFFDILISLLGIILLLPLFLVITIVIYFSSGTPILYIQKRVGKNNIDFGLLKFRSMYVNADKKGLLTVGMTDNRIIHVGKFLRKYKLDELPQLFNVLMGTMSIVGPRPEVRKYVDLYTTSQRKILQIKPGITDWASIIFFNENELLAKSNNPEKTYIEIIMPEKIKLNMKFVNSPTLINYFKIIFYTIKRIIFN